MKTCLKQIKTMVLALLAVFTIGTVNAQKPVKIIQGKDTLIQANRTWDCDTVYFLRGKVYVTNSAELTIQPGTIITGDTITKGTLIVTRGSKVHAIGTPSCPIVFTSSKAPNKRNRGDWGGVILLGSAATNNPGGTQYIEGLPASSLTQFGGGTNPNPHDNSGELKYVRIEFAGVALSPNNEINGLTMGAVGDGTTIDYVQVSYANDDSYEWFGGSVNCKHLIAFRGLDDDFDTDNGYSGKVQFAFGLRDPKVADVSGSKGFESDNDANGSTNLPQTRAIFSNITVDAGADSATNLNFVAGAHIRRNSHLYIYNSILMGYPEGLLIDGTLSQNNVLADTIVQNNIVACKYAPKYVVTASPSDNTSVINLLKSQAANRFYANNAGVKLTAPYNLTNPNLLPKTGSPALSGASFKHIGLSDPFFTKTTYVGAFAQAANLNWATVWVNFTPTATDYTTACACSNGFAESAAADEKTASEISFNAKGEVSISPNPSRGIFNISLGNLSGNVTIKVTNMNGTPVYNKQVAAGKSNVNIDLSNSSAGLYFVSIASGNQTIMKKINIIH